jgi:hypothetical protein
VLRARFVNLDPRAAIPVGYDLGSAYLPPQKDGGISSVTRISGQGSLTATALRVRLSTATIAGSASITSSLAVLTQGASSITGTGSVTAALLATSKMQAALAGSASLTASLNALVPLSASIAGSGAIASNLKGKGAMSATIQVGAATELTASDIWTYDISAINTAGTSGKKLNDASSGTNPWDALLTSHTTSGTFGWFMQKLLTVAKFLGLK